MGTSLPARSSDGCDLGPFLAGAGALVSRSPLSARSTNCGLETIPSVLGNDGNEIRVIEQSAVAKMVRRITDLRISPSRPREHTQQTSRIALSSSVTGFADRCRKSPRQDKSHKPCGEANRRAQCGKSACWARYSVPENLPSALVTLVNQHDDQQKQIR
jgi:hypothetical protein